MTIHIPSERCHRDADGVLVIDGATSDIPVHPHLRGYVPSVQPVRAQVLSERTEVPVSWQEQPLVAEAGDFLLTDFGGLGPSRPSCSRRRTVASTREPGPSA